MQHPRTDAALKYGPTKTYGPCEVEACAASARTSCSACGGDFCFGHAEHDVHAAIPTEERRV